MAKQTPLNLQTSPKNKLAPWLWIILILGAIAGYGFSSFVLILKINNGEFYITRYPIKRENWTHPRLKQLREQEKLDQVIASGKTEFEKIILLRKWTRSQWEGSQQFYYPPWDAIEILNLARTHHNKPFCAQYAIVFLQACTALGIPARYVDLPGHFVVEVWSNEYNCWVLMDTTKDIHFEKNGFPLKGTKIAEAYWKNNTKGIYKVKSDFSKEPVQNRNELNIYRMFSIVLRTNHLSEPIAVIINKKPIRPLLIENDYKKYPYVGKDSIGFGEDFVEWNEEDQTEFFVDKMRSHDVDDFAAMWNQSMIYIGSKNSDTGMIKLRLEHENSSDMKCFLIQTDDNQIWKEADDLVLWKIHSGLNRLEAKIKTQHNWEGPESSILIFYKKRWLSQPNKTEYNAY